MPAPRRLNLTLDETTDEILRRVAKPGQEAAYARAAIVEKAARDALAGEIDVIRSRLARVEHALGLDSAGAEP